MKRKFTGNVKLPEENVEYTFVFPGQRFISYVFVCQRADGRVVLMNTTTKEFTNMTAGWFAKLRRRQLISAKPYNKEYCVVQDSQNGVSEVKEQKLVEKSSNKESLSEYELRLISELRTLSPAEAFSVQALIGRTPQALANELESLDDNCTQEYVNRVFSDLMKAGDCYRRLRGNVANNIFNVTL